MLPVSKHGMPAFPISIMQCPKDLQQWVPTWRRANASRKNVSPWSRAARSVAILLLLLLDTGARDGARLCVRLVGTSAALELNGLCANGNRCSAGQSLIALGCCVGCEEPRQGGGCMDITGV